MLDLGKDSVVVGVRKPRLPVLVAGLVLVLAGCSGDDPEPKMAPTESVASTPSTSAATVSPSTDVTPFPDSVRSFVRAWFGALSAAMTSGELATVSNMSDHDCVSCLALFKSISGIYDAGGHVETDGWFVERFARAGGFDADAPVLLLRVRQESRTLFDGDVVVDRTPSMKVPMRVALSRRTGTWVVTELEILG